MVSGEAKQRVVGLLRDYALEARAELDGALRHMLEPGLVGAKALLAALSELPMLVPFLQPQNLAIPVSVKARVLKMAALYDLPLTMRIMEEEVFAPVRAALPEEGEVRSRADEIAAKIRQELCSNVAEEGAEFTGGQTPATCNGSPSCRETPVGFNC